MLDQFFRGHSLRYVTVKANTSGSDQTGWMHRLFCAFVVRIQQSQVFSRRGPFLGIDPITFHRSYFHSIKKVQIISFEWHHRNIYICDYIKPLEPLMDFISIPVELERIQHKVTYHLYGY